MSTAYPLSYPFPQLPAPLIVNALSPPISFSVSLSHCRTTECDSSLLFIWFDVFIPSGELTGRTSSQFYFSKGSWCRTKLGDDKRGLYCSMVIT